MLFKTLATIFVTTSVTLVNAAPSPANNELEARFSPAHNLGNVLNARHARHHAKMSQIPKRNRRVRRSCPANTSAVESIADVTATPTDSPAPADTPAQSPSDTPAAPADTPAPSPDPQPSSSGDSSSNDNSSSSTSNGDIQAYLG